MNFLKALFGNKTETDEEKKREESAKNFDVLKYDGVRALRSGELAYAIKCFRHAADIHEDLEVTDYLSQALIMSGDLLPAYDCLQKLADAQPDNEEIFVRMANVAYMMENYGAMGDACEKAALINKDNPTVMYLYAKACIGQGDDVNAIAMLTKAIALDSKLNDAMLLRGETLLRMGDTGGALEDASTLMETVENNEDVMLLRAKVHVAMGEHNDAIELYNRIIDLNPFCTAAFKGRGEARMTVGDKAGAEEDMKTLLELEPQKAESVNGEYTAEGKEGIQCKVEQAYKNNNPLGL